MDKYNHLAEQNSKDIQENTESIEQNLKDIQENSILLEKNLKMTEGNIVEIHRIGVLMEQLQDSMQLVIESNITNRKLMRQTAKRLDDNEIKKLPTLWKKPKFLENDLKSRKYHQLTLNYCY